MSDLEKEYDDETEQMISIRMLQVDKQRDRIEFALGELIKDLNAVANRKKQDKQSRLVEWGGFVAFCVICKMTVDWLKTSMFSAPAYLLALLLAGAIFTFLCYNVKKMMCYMVWCVQRTSGCIEMNRLYTYAKEEEYYYNCIAQVREKRKQLEQIERALKKNGDLDEEQLHFVNSPNVAHCPNFIYTDKTVSVKDWVKVILFGG